MKNYVFSSESQIKELTHTLKKISLEKNFIGNIMTSNTNRQSYNLDNQDETKALARQIKSVLTHKGYSISTPQLIQALNSSTVNKIDYLDRSHEIDFTTINLLNSLDSDCIISYFLSNTRKWELHDRMKELFSAIVSACVWLRDNNGETLDMDLLRKSLILNVIEEELITHKKLPQHIIQNLLSYLHTIRGYLDPIEIRNSENIAEYHGYLQMHFCSSFIFLAENTEQIKHNAFFHSRTKLLAYHLKAYLKEQQKNIKHSDLFEAIVISLGYKNHHVYSAEYKKFNESHLYKNKIKNVDCLFQKGMSSQIMDAIIYYIPINKNNICGLYLIRAITKVLVYIRETEKTPITFERIISLFDVDNLFQVIEKYRALTGLNKYDCKVSLPFDIGGNYKIFSADKCFALYTESVRDGYSGIVDTAFKERHAYITDCLKKALTLLENNGIK